MSRQEEMSLWHRCVLLLALCLASVDAGFGGPPPLPRHRARAMMCRPGVEQVIRYLDEFNAKVDEDAESIIQLDSRKVIHRVDDVEIEYADEFEEVLPDEVEYVESPRLPSREKTTKQSPLGEPVSKGPVLVYGKVSPPGNPRDPIYTASKRVTSGKKSGVISSGRVPGYSFAFHEELAPKLRKVSLGSVPLKLKREIRLQLALKHQALPSGLTIQKNVTVVKYDNGFFVYFVHPHLPKSLESAPHGQRLTWAKEHATHVIKLLKGDYQDSPFDWVPYLEFDLSIKPLLDHLATRATDRGKPFIEFLSTATDFSDHSRGTLIQKAVHGVSAHDIQDAINLLSDTQRVKEIDIEELGRAYKIIASFSGGDLDEAQRKIHALEQFMRDITPVVKRQRERSQLGRPGFLANEAPPGSPFDGISVEVDYNLGQNVIWDEKRQIFVMFDY